MSVTGTAPTSVGDGHAVAIDEHALGHARDRLRQVLTETAAGPRVAVMAGTSAEAIAALEACASLGLSVVPISDRAAVPEVAYVLAHARPSHLLVAQRCVELAGRAFERLLPVRRPSLHAIEPIAVRTVTDGVPLQRPVAGGIRPETIGATTLYTSGTTGRPKGCVRTAEQEAARARELVATYSLTGQDVHLVVCPLNYSAPSILTRATRAIGAATVLLPRFAPDALLDAVARCRVTFVFMVPTQLHRVLAEARQAAHDLSSLRAVVIAGAPMPADLRARAVDWLGPGRLWEFYGSSETGTISVLPPSEQLTHPDTVGKLAPGVQVRIEHPRGDDSETVEHGGVLWVRSETVMSGYWNPVTETVDWPGDDRGYVTVGDLARVDQDGWLTLYGRQADTIITGGSNVYPAEVEHALVRHASVDTAVVFAIADPEYGQRVAAAVVLAAGAELHVQALREFLRAHLSPHKIPKTIVAIDADEIPRTTSGKPKRKALASLIRNRHPS